MGYEEEEPFDVVMFGYDKGQVDAYVQAQAKAEKQLTRQVSGLPDFESQLAESRAEVAKLRGTIARLTEDLTATRPSLIMSARMDSMLRLAEEEAAAIRAEAQTSLVTASAKAEALLDTSRTEAENILRQAREDANLAAASRRHAAESKPRKPRNDAARPR